MVGIMSKNKKMLLIYIFMLTVGQILIVLILSGIEEIGNRVGIPLVTEKNGLAITNITIYLILLVSVCLLFGSEIKQEWQQGKGKIIKQILGYGIGFCLAGIVIVGTVKILGINTTENQEIVENIMVSANWLSSIITVVIAGPVVEEIVFRYIIMGKIRPYGRKKAIIISSVLFGILHLKGINIVEFFVYFILGICLGIIYDKANKITVSIGVHCLYNVINVAFFYVLINLG